MDNRGQGMQINRDMRKGLKKKKIWTHQNQHLSDTRMIKLSAVYKVDSPFQQKLFVCPIPHAIKLQP